MGRLNDGRDSGAGEIPPGSTRLIDVKDKSGNVLKTLTVFRTDREYVYDLCDAYNAGMAPAARERGCEWFVAPNGELKLGDNSAWSRFNLQRIERQREAERNRQNRRTTNPSEPAPNPQSGGGVE